MSQWKGVRLHTIRPSSFSWVFFFLPWAFLLPPSGRVVTGFFLWVHGSITQPSLYNRLAARALFCLAMGVGRTCCIKRANPVNTAWWQRRAAPSLLLLTILPVLILDL